MRQLQAVWLSWHNGSRSRSLSSQLGVPFRVYNGRQTGFLRHVFGTLWTVGEIWRSRPSTLLLQNSFMLLAVASIYKSCAKNRIVLIADCHNKSLKRRLCGPLKYVFFTIKRWSFRQADLVVVSNDAMLEPAGELSNRVLVLRDPLPSDFCTIRCSVGENVNSVAAELVPAEPYALFPCSFESDEPIECIFSVAGELARLKIASVITGDSQRIKIPKSVRSTPLIFMPGYVPDTCYRALLAKSSVVIALTDDQDCLMCAAYEAVAAGRPLVVSDTPVLRACFKSSAVYAKNQPHSVVSAVSQVLSVAKSQSSKRARAELESAFRHEFDRLLTTLRDLTARGIPRCSAPLSGRAWQSGDGDAR